MPETTISHVQVQKMVSETYAQLRQDSSTAYPFTYGDMTLTFDTDTTRHKFAMVVSANDTIYGLRYFVSEQEMYGAFLSGIDMCTMMQEVIDSAMEASVSEETVPNDDAFLVGWDSVASHLGNPDVSVPDDVQTKLTSNIVSYRPFVDGLFLATDIVSEVRND